MKDAISAEPSQGNGGGSIQNMEVNVTVKPNLSMSTQTETLDVTSGEITRSVDVTQMPNFPFFWGRVSVGTYADPLPLGEGYNTYFYFAKEGGVVQPQLIIEGLAGNFILCFGVLFPKNTGFENYVKNRLQVSYREGQNSSGPWTAVMPNIYSILCDHEVNGSLVSEAENMCVIGGAVPYTRGQIVNVELYWNNEAILKIFVG